MSSSALIPSSKSLLLVALFSKALIRCSRSVLGDGLLEANSRDMLIGAGLVLVLGVGINLLLLAMEGFGATGVVGVLVVGSFGNWFCNSVRYLFIAGGVDDGACLFVTTGMIELMFVSILLIDSLADLEFFSGKDHISDRAIFVV